MAISLEFANPEFPRLGKQIELCGARGLPMAQPGTLSHLPGVVICGLGTSVEDKGVIREIKKLAREGWGVLSMKEGVGRLTDRHGIKVDYCINMDPGLGDLKRTTPRRGVVFFVASSCHPKVFDKLVDGGAEVQVYHNACGFPSELTLYEYFFSNQEVIGGGYTVLNRAMGLMEMMGAPNQVLAGADFGLREGSTYYAKFVGAEPWKMHWLNDNGEVDGKPWITKPDLLASAGDIARRIKRGYKVRILGDSLAKSLSLRDEDFIDRCAMIDRAGNKREPDPPTEAELPDAPQSKD